MKTTESDYWTARWEAGQTGWDAGLAAPAICAYFDQITDKSLRILVPGCGNGYEAEYLFRQGFRNVFAADFAVTPLQNLQKRCPDFPEENLLQGDFFKLAGQFDRIVEHTFLSALPPEKREDYALKMNDLLAPGGKLVGLVFSQEFEESGPPFGASPEDYRALFGSKFHFRHFGPARQSIGPRQGREHFVCLEKKAPSVNSAD